MMNTLTDSALSFPEENRKAAQIIESVKRTDTVVEFKVNG